MVEGQLGFRKVFVKVPWHQTVAGMLCTVEADKQANITDLQASLPNVVQRKVHVACSSVLLKDVL